jgi:hypothetical protein
MRHYTLRFPDEQAARDAAGGVGYLDDDGELVSLGHKGALDIIGEVVLPGTYDDDGNELTPPVILPGYYVNLALPGPLPRALASFRVPYGSGGRIFAGTDPDPDAWPYGSGS